MRDVTCREDQARANARNAPQALAALRNMHCSPCSGTSGSSPSKASNTSPNIASKPSMSCREGEPNDPEGLGGGAGAIRALACWHWRPGGSCGRQSGMCREPVGIWSAPTREPVNRGRHAISSAGWDLQACQSIGFILLSLTII